MIKHSDDTYSNPMGLEHWLGTMFKKRVVPHFIVMRFEQWRDVIEAELGLGKTPTLEEVTGLDDDQLKSLIEDANTDMWNAQFILCSANQLPDGTLLLGARHDDHLMNAQLDVYLAAHGIEREEVIIDRWNQGFIDQWGNFLTRSAAWLVAEKANQIKRTGPGFSGPDLYSENLW